MEDNMKQSATVRKLMEEAKAKGARNREYLAQRAEEQVLSEALEAERGTSTAGIEDDMLFTMGMETDAAVVRKIRATIDILFVVLLRHSTSKEQMTTMLREITKIMNLLADDVATDLDVLPDRQPDGKEVA